MPPARPLRRPVVPTARTGSLPAPVGGLNTVDAGLAMSPMDCVQAYNLIAAENGLRVRYGEQEWCTGLTGSSDNTVRTLIPFAGASSASLFATTNTGIWDVTTSSDSPVQVVTFPSPAGNAGHGVATAMVAAGGHYLFYADEENGLYRYAETGATWTKVAAGVGAGEIDGVDPADLVFATAFKGRAWFVEQSTSSAWYLDPGVIAGTAEEFPLTFSKGGTLLGLWTWTYDGGAGVDDSLVAVSSNGEVLIYQGTDPSSAMTFGLKGTWYAGPPPAGRSIATADGGDLLLLVRHGVVSLSKLVVGADPVAQSTSVKVTNLLNTLMGERRTYRGWGMLQHPEDAAFLLLVPRGSGAYALQLAQATASKGWFVWRDLDMASAAAWEKKLFFGTTDGRVCRNTGYVDGVTLADPNTFSAIDWSFLSAASDFGAPTNKQVSLLRPLILSEGAEPSFSVEARYGYSQNAVDPVSLVAGSGDVWGTGVWGTALWSGASAPSQETHGASGMGTHVAVAMRGVSVAKTTLLGVDVVYTSGGFL